MIDIGVVTEVLQRDQAVFLDVELRHHDRTALVRWCPPYHGEGFGAWWVPGVGADVVCMFPGLSIDGRDEDLDEGYAVAVVSSMPEPPVAGLQGPLGLLRRVFKGRAGEAQDDHYQGTHDLQVDGAQVRLFLATRATQVNGAEARTNQSTLSWVIQQASTWLSQTTASFTGAVLLRLLSNAKVQIDAPIVELGLSGAVKRIVHEDLVPLFNAHTHSNVENGPGTSGPPVQQAAVGVHTSSRARVDS